MLSGLTSDSYGCMALLLTRYLKGGAAGRAPGLILEMANVTLSFYVDG
jgi:hypothetical protein